MEHNGAQCTLHESRSELGTRERLFDRLMVGGSANVNEDSRGESGRIRTRLFLGVLVRSF